MRPVDWAALAVTLIGIVSYGLYRSRGSNTVDNYLLAGKTMPWYAMALSIMATQASAITFISTTGQSYVDGMRFVQFYFGLPLAMVMISATAVPIFHRAKVYTAYEYLEQRFGRVVRLAGGALMILGQVGGRLSIVLLLPSMAFSAVTGLNVYLSILLIVIDSLGVGETPDSAEQVHNLADGCAQIPLELYGTDFWIHTHPWYLTNALCIKTRRGPTAAGPARVAARAVP